MYEGDGLHVIWIGQRGYNGPGESGEKLGGGELAGRWLKSVGGKELSSLRCLFFTGGAPLVEDMHSTLVFQIRSTAFCGAAQVSVRYSGSSCDSSMEDSGPEAVPWVMSLSFFPFGVRDTRFLLARGISGKSMLLHTREMGAAPFSRDSLVFQSLEVGACEGH